MKVTCIALLLALAATPLQAHEEVMVIDVPDYGAVSYNAPVTYYAPVLYQSAVVYNAPVFYITASAPAPVCQPSVVYAPVSPNVIITGGSRAGAYYSSWDTTPNVIVVGRSCQPRVTPARFR